MSEFLISNRKIRSMYYNSIYSCCILQIFAWLQVKYYGGDKPYSRCAYVNKHCWKFCLLTERSLKSLKTGIFPFKRSFQIFIALKLLPDCSDKSRMVHFMQCFYQEWARRWLLLNFITWICCKEFRNENKTDWLFGDTEISGWYFFVGKSLFVKAICCCNWNEGVIQGELYGHPRKFYFPFFMESISIRNRKK